MRYVLVVIILALSSMLVGRLFQRDDTPQVQILLHDHYYQLFRAASYATIALLVCSSSYKISASFSLSLASLQRDIEQRK